MGSFFNSYHESGFFVHKHETWQNWFGEGDNEIFTQPFKEKKLSLNYFSTTSIRYFFALGFIRSTNMFSERKNYFKCSLFSTQFYDNFQTFPPRLQMIHPIRKVCLAASNENSFSMQQFSRQMRFYTRFLALLYSKYFYFKPKTE